MLSGEEKTYLINEMMALMDNHGESAPANTQIRKYASMATKSDCKEEFLNYLHYQIGRSYKEKSFLIKVLNQLNEIEKRFDTDERYLEGLGFFFGYMARYKKYIDVTKIREPNNGDYPRSNNHSGNKNYPQNKTNAHGKRR
jgi:hypothetical protein